MAGWSGEDRGRNRLDFIIPSGRCGLTAFEDSLLLLFCLPAPQGYSTVPKDSKIGTGTWEPQHPPVTEDRLSEETGEGCFGGAEFL